MHLQFHGAARTVTGSMHLVSVNGSTVLLDCGMYQGRRAEAWERNRNFPFDPASIDAVVLSHAHIDHSGNLPGLVRQGFRGRIFATHATQSLCAVMLRDSAFIQQRDVEFINKKHRKKGLPPIEPLYDENDVDATTPLFTGQDYARPFDVADGVSCRFEDAGHILGSASVSVTLREGKTVRRLAYTGDLGRPQLPILRDPVFVGDPEGTEYLISESTYGGRLHAPIADMESQLLEPIRRASDRRGKIVIPAFSVGRTQELVYVLHRMRRKGLVENLPVFVDSPLSVNVTEVFRKHPECYDEETREMLHSSEDNDPFGFEQLTYIRSAENSRELNDRPGPFIVIASSGMCEAGRILHHLANSIGDPRNMVLIVGYQAEQTLGKKLVMREPVVNIFGEPHELRAEVTVLNSFSGHADRDELVTYLAQFERSTLRSTFLVHGDLDQSEKLGTVLRERGFRDVGVPVRGQKVLLD